MRIRQAAPAAFVLALTVGGFFVARAVGERDASRDSEHRAEIAATQVRDRIDQAANLVDGVRRFLAGPVGAGVSEGQFVDTGSRWLGPAGVPAAAWMERVPDSDRAAYERRTGLTITAPARSGRMASVGPRASYLPATLVTRVPPMTTAGMDLRGTPGVAAAVARPQTAYGVSATPLASLADGTAGLFLVRSAQRLVRGGVVQPGFVALFLPASWLLSAAEDTAGSAQGLGLTVGGTSTGDQGSAGAARSTFAAAGQRFEVRVQRSGVDGAAEALPWIILSAGLALAVLVGAVGVNAARRAKAKAEVDRFFTLSPDLIVVAGFDGYFKRVNPAFETRLGYTEEEATARPLTEFVDPADRDGTEAAGTRLREGETVVSFENRYVAKDGSRRWIEWTATPVADEEAVYGVGRDVTERRQAERDLGVAEEQYRTLAEAQAALRRVATLVAQRVSPRESFAASAVEVRRLLGADSAALGRYEPDGTATVLAVDDDSELDIPVGSRLSLGSGTTMEAVLRTGRVSRTEGFEHATGPIGKAARRMGIRSSVGAPIVVEGRAWGVIVVSSKAGRLPADTEQRLVDFAELVATAIADAESRTALARLAEDQAALRRVATLVAEGVPPAEVFAALAEEVSLLLGARAVLLARLERGERATVLATGGTARDVLELGSHLKLEPGMVIAKVLETRGPARIDREPGSSAPYAWMVPQSEMRAAVGVPIFVQGALWGVIGAEFDREQIARGAERRMAEFTELAATAIANAEGRAELAASRARVVTASDETRRRIERDLHDGTQQRLVSISLDVRSAEETLPADLDEPRRALGRVVDGLDGAINELREISRGIHPAILSQGGLGPALRTLARRSALPVDLRISAKARLPEPIEVASYYVVSETLTNAAKHARASRVEVDVAERGDRLRLSIHDDGVGGADLRRGSGLIGLRDRVEALGGSIDVSSPAGGGTHIVVDLPLGLE